MHALETDYIDYKIMFECALAALITFQGVKL